jgi:hypothetical protein
MNRIYRSLLIVALLTVPAAAANEMTFKIARAELVCTVENDVPVPRTLHFIFDKSLNADELIQCDDPNDKKCLEKRRAAQQWIHDNLLSLGNYTLIQKDSRVFGELGVILRLPSPLMGPAPTPDPGPTPTPIPAPTPVPTPWVATRNTAPDHVLDNTLIATVTTFDLSEGYLLIAKNLSQDTPAPSMTVVQVNSSCDSFGHVLPKPEDPKKKEKDEKEAWEKRKIGDFFKEPAIKESPILKFDFGMQGAMSQKSIFSFDVNFRPYVTRRLGFGGHYEFTPVFVETVYNINAKEGDRKNVLNVGVAQLNWTKVFRDDGGENAHAPNLWRFKVFPGFAFSLTPKMETEWRFKEMNFLLSPKAELPINVYQSRQTTLQVAPFIGIDLGIKARTEAKEGAGWQIGRPFIGAGLVALLGRTKEKPLFEIKADYIRRLFLRPELSYGFDASGKEVPDRHSKRVREYGMFKLTWNAADLLAPFVQWEYGRVPPNYSLLNHSFKTGFTVNADLAWKAFK